MTRARIDGAMRWNIQGKVNFDGKKYCERTSLAGHRAKYEDPRARKVESRHRSIPGFEEGAVELEEALDIGLLYFTYLFKSEELYDYLVPWAISGPVAFSLIWGNGSLAFSFTHICMTISVRLAL